MLSGSTVLVTELPVAGQCLRRVGATGAIGLEERFLISGTAPVTWRQFYTAYEHMLGVQGVALMPSGGTICVNSEPTEMLRGETVLVTGVTGPISFIGGRLVEKLVLYHDAKVRVLLNNAREAVRVARFPVQMVKASLTDPKAVDCAVAGCSVVFHCAYDVQDLQRNLEAAPLLAEACLRNRVRCLVHLSSFGVYEPLQDGFVNESSPREPCGWKYADNKLAIERSLLHYAEASYLPVTVIQPSIVYGPFAENWTYRPVRQLRNGRVILPEDGDGLCNAVYVDDVVDALIRAAEEEKALGECFLISGPTLVTWREFYAAYEQILGVQSVILVPGDKLKHLVQRNSVIARFRRARRNPGLLLDRRPIKRLRSLTCSWVPDSFRDRVKRVLPAPWHIPDEETLSLYQAHCIIRSDKARHWLGYVPQFSFDRGMALTAKFIQWANL